MAGISRRLFDQNVNLENPLSRAKFMMDLSLMIDDLVDAVNTFQNLPTHADNAAALLAGLVANQFYKTPTGQIMQVY